MRISLRSLVLPLLPFVFAVGCSAGSAKSESERFGAEGAGIVDKVYTENGWMSLEDEYIPRVCTQENGNADTEALKAQAVAARTYLLRSMRDDVKLGTTAEPVHNGQSFQAYAAHASQACIDATN